MNTQYNRWFMNKVKTVIISSKMQYEDRPAFGYQVILLTPVSQSKIYWTLYTIVEYEYGSLYSYLARDEAEARKLAVQYALQAITEHWDRRRTRMEALIYPFGGLLRDMRLVPRESV